MLFLQERIRLENWDMILDPVECMMAAGSDLPREISPEQAVKILDVGDELERLNYPDNLGGLLGGNMMTHILNLMDTARTANRSATKCVFQFLIIYIFSVFFFFFFFFFCSGLGIYSRFFICLLDIVRLFPLC